MKNSGTAVGHFCQVENRNGAQPSVLDAAVLCCAVLCCCVSSLPCAVLSVRADAEEISYLIQIGSLNNCRKYDKLEIYFMLHWYIRFCHIKLTFTIQRLVCKEPGLPPCAMLVREKRD